MGIGEDGYDEHRRSAHDLLQSVAIMQALLGALRASDAVGPEGREQLALIAREVQLVAALCQRQLGDAPPVGSVDLARVVTEVVERSRLTYDGEITLQVDEAAVEGDALEWTRCLYNLVENACRAASDHGTVSVGVTVSDSTIRVTVGDSGPGFGEAVAGRASLGMLTVNRVVQQHSGHLELRQSPLGGAELRIVVPQRR